MEAEGAGWQNPAHPGTNTNKEHDMGKQDNNYTVGEHLYRAEARVWHHGDGPHVDVVFTLWRVDRVTNCGAWLARVVEHPHWEEPPRWRKSGTRYARRTREEAVGDLCARTRHRVWHAARRLGDAYAVARKLGVGCPLEHIGDCHHDPGPNPDWGC